MSAAGAQREEARFVEALEAALERAAAQGEPVSVIVAVLHPGAAECAAGASCAAEAARTVLPPAGLAARVAPDRMALLLPGIAPGEARARAARIAARCPSLSLGVAALEPHAPPRGPHALLVEAEAAAGGSRPRLLVVEDEPAAGEILEAFFAANGRFEVLVARSGAEAVAKARARPPDVALLDLELPDMDGAAVLARLREAVADLPALAVSGKRPEDAAGAGFTAFHRKPLDFPALVREVERLLERSTGP